MNQREDFIKFLKEHGVLEAYENNKDYGFDISTVAPSSYVARAFIWEDTPEGYDFWYKIGMEWNKVRRSYKDS